MESGVLNELVIVGVVSGMVRAPLPTLQVSRRGCVSWPTWCICGARGGSYWRAKQASALVAVIRVGTYAEAAVDRSSQVLGEQAMTMRESKQKQAWADCTCGDLESSWIWTSWTRRD